MRIAVISNGDILMQRPCYVFIGDELPKSMVHVMAAVRAANPAFNSAAGLCAAWDGDRILHPSSLIDNERYVAVGDDGFMLKRVRVSERIPVLAVRESASVMADYRSRSRQRTPSLERAASEAQQQQPQPQPQPQQKMLRPQVSSTSSSYAVSFGRLGQHDQSSSHTSANLPVGRSSTTHIVNGPPQQQQPRIKKRPPPPPAADEESDSPHLRPARQQQQQQPQAQQQPEQHVADTADVQASASGAAQTAASSSSLEINRGVAAVQTQDTGSHEKTPLNEERATVAATATAADPVPASSGRDKRSVSRNAETQHEVDEQQPERTNNDSTKQWIEEEAKSDEVSPPATADCSTSVIGQEEEKEEEDVKNQQQPEEQNTASSTVAADAATGAAPAASSLSDKLKSTSRPRDSDSDSSSNEVHEELPTPDKKEQCPEKKLQQEDSERQAHVALEGTHGPAAPPAATAPPAPPPPPPPPPPSAAAAVSSCTVETQTDRVVITAFTGEEVRSGEQNDDDENNNNNNNNVFVEDSPFAASPTPKGRQSAFLPALYPRDVCSKDEKMELYEFVNNNNNNSSDNPNSEGSNGAAAENDNAQSAAAPANEKIGALTSKSGGSGGNGAAAARQFARAWGNLLELQDFSSGNKSDSNNGVMFADAIAERICPGFSQQQQQKQKEERSPCDEGDLLDAHKMVFQSRVIVGPERSGRSTALRVFVDRVLQPFLVDSLVATGGVSKWWCLPMSFKQLRSVMYFEQQQQQQQQQQQPLSWQPISQGAVHWVTSLFESIAVHRGPQHAYGLTALSNFFCSAFNPSAVASGAGGGVPALPASAKTVAASHTFPALSLLWSNLHKLAAQTALALMPQQQQAHSAASINAMFHALFRMPLLLRESLGFERVLLLVDDVDEQLLPRPSGSAADVSTAMLLLADVVKNNPRMSLVCTARDCSLFPRDIDDDEDGDEGVDKKRSAKARPSYLLQEVCTRCSLRGVASAMAMFRELRMPPVLCVEEKAVGNTRRRAAFQHRFLSSELFGGLPGFAIRFFTQELRLLSGAVLLMQRGLLQEERDLLQLDQKREEEEDASNNEGDETPFALVITDFPEMAKLFLSLAEKVSSVKY